MIREPGAAIRSALAHFGLTFLYPIESLAVSSYLSSTELSRHANRL